MRIAAAQFCPVYSDLSGNTETIVKTISSVDADLIVFPELATSGYFYLSPQEVIPVAQSVNDTFVSRIVEAADKARRVVVCGFAESHNGHLYNSAIICVPGEPPSVYRKSHLFYKEGQSFSPGNTGFTVRHIPQLDCTLGTMICYDWRFPEAARTLALRGADVIVCPSNLVTHVWRLAMPTRALENGVFLAVANRTGQEENGNETVSFNGQSAIYSTTGQVLAEADASQSCVIVADVDVAAARTKNFNSVNNIFTDRRPDLYFSNTDKP